MKRKAPKVAGFLLSLVVAVGAANESAAQGQPRYWSSGRMLTAEPKMNFVPNTDIYYNRKAPAFDLYRHADRWYLVDDGQWHHASTWRGPFLAIPLDEVPEDLTTLPRVYRRHWRAPDEDDLVEGSATSPRTLTSRPSMRKIGTGGVRVAIRATDYDLYRYKGIWYLVENGVWHRSESWRGPYVSIPVTSVPREVRNVPSAYRRHWVVRPS